MCFHFTYTCTFISCITLTHTWTLSWVWQFCMFDCWYFFGLIRGQAIQWNTKLCFRSKLNTVHHVCNWNPVSSCFFILFVLDANHTSGRGAYPTNVDLILFKLQIQVVTTAMCWLGDVLPSHLLNGRTVKINLCLHFLKQMQVIICLFCY